jgi:hypothetical protein
MIDRTPHNTKSMDQNPSSEANRLLAQNYPRDTEENQ